ncbi:MAG TPA: hypothetical protein VGJ84_02910, partial [Polyangiaceae bacterium]
MSYRLLVGAWPASSQRILLGALLPLGHQVVTARSEAAALGLLRKEPTDLVVHAWPERGSSPAR